MTDHVITFDLQVTKAVSPVPTGVMTMLGWWRPVMTVRPVCGHSDCPTLWWP